MEIAIEFTERMNEFVHTLLTSGPRSVEVQAGRRFSRVLTDSAVAYFVDRNTWTIYGAKSATQFNPRREYGTLKTVAEYDWSTDTPKPGTAAAKTWEAREAAITAAYKKRGRPRKQPVGAP